MQQVLERLLPQPLPATTAGLIRALKEVLQTLALLGLWRSGFFEHSSFYGGTALRLLYGLDRFSEDLDFSLLEPSESFDFSAYGSAVVRELNSYGFEVWFEPRKKTAETTIESAFLKANTLHQLIIIEAPMEQLKGIGNETRLKIKLEIDTRPPGGFETEMKYIFSPVQYAVRTFTLPSLFAGKMHALLCRKWKNRVKGRDWYDFIWYTSHYPQVNLHHLEERMRQSGHYEEPGALTLKGLKDRVFQAIEELNIDAAVQEVSPFVNDFRSVDLWSKDFLRAAAERIVVKNT